MNKVALLPADDRAALFRETASVGALPTGPDYGRIYDHKLVEAVQRIASNGGGIPVGKCLLRYGRIVSFVLHIPQICSAKVANADTS